MIALAGLSAETATVLLLYLDLSVKDCQAPADTDRPTRRP